MNYDIKIYDIDSFAKIKFINEYITQLNGLVKLCFGYEWTNEQIMNYIGSHSQILIAKDGDKIIGMACIGQETVINFNPKKTKYYKKNPKYMEPYILKQAFRSNRKFFISHATKIYPMLNCFCRDPNKIYKGLGKYMLSQIINFFKGKIDEIYCIAESTKGLSHKQKGDNFCGVNYGYNNKNNEYYNTNMLLIEYYKKL